MHVNLQIEGTMMQVTIIIAGKEDKHNKRNNACFDNSNTNNMSDNSKTSMVLNKNMNIDTDDQHCCYYYCY